MRRERTCRTLLVPLAALALLGLSGCEGTFTADLATEAPADPDIAQVDVTLRGLEFEKSGGDTTQVEFRDGEPVDLMDLTSGTPMRVFTDEQLPEGDYTGVRLLFEKDTSVTVTDTAGGQFDGRLEEGEFAPVDFSVKQDERSREAMTLALDLRRSLVFDDAAKEYVLTPVLRSVPTADAASITGTIRRACPAGTSLTTGGAVYAFEGRSVEPDDLDGSNAEPFATARVTNSFGLGVGEYALRFLPAGEYTLALTCSGDQDSPGSSEDLRFGTAVNVRITAGQSAPVNFD